ncbi:hypothetical protein KFK09_000734 [Dendrobium nobile]|uniref:Uncharacterized protein n=1 Tax=Dendrobium nobile TaxID=94219 RepID=A0A8T3C9R8_DENNO|nr:hypothetical protein KFK09_000734 [Dendrobium nobile]
MEERVGTSNQQSSVSSSKNPEKLQDGRIWPSKLHISEEVMNNICTKRQRANEMMIQSMDLKTRFEALLDECNIEFVNAKYLQEEYEQRLNAKIKETSALKSQLAEYRAELAMMSNSLALQHQEVDLSNKELIKERAKICQRDKALSILQAEKGLLEAENKRLQDRLSEREAREEVISLKAIEDFKKSSAYQREIHNRIQEAHDKIFATEMRELERQSLEEGFVRGFLKGVRLVRRKINDVVEGLSPSQASEDSPPDLDDDGIKSELRTFSGDDEEDDEII